MAEVSPVGRDFKSTLSLATRQYDEYIKPVWPFMIRGYGIPVEGKTDDDLANKLDQLAGIDIFNIDGDVTYGVASRIQTGKAWNTFTVRKKNFVFQFFVRFQTGHHMTCDFLQLVQPVHASFSFQVSFDSFSL